MKEKKRTPKLKKMRVHMMNKMLFVMFIVSCVFILLIIRVVYLKNKYEGDYGNRVLSQQSSVSSTLPYRRGDIVDRNGTILATSKKVYNLIFDPKVLLTNENYIEPTIEALTSVFEIEEKTLRDIITEKPDSSYNVMIKKIDYEKVNQFTAMMAENKKIKGVWFEEEYERVYPNNSLASHVIGYTSAGNVGTWGLEQYYNSSLNGTDGRVYGYFDSELNLIKTIKNPTNGNTIISSIDSNVQAIVERYIKEYMEEVGAKNIGIIIANPNNGEIYAMANNHPYDLNDPYNMDAYYTQEEQKAMSDKEKTDALNLMWRNFCVNDTYVPGSTFKPFTVAAGLEENVVAPESTFECKGYIVVAGRVIHCNATHGTVTLAQALEKSCNPALISIGEGLGTDSFRAYQKRFNFGLKTGVDLPGEAAGILVKEGSLNITELATCSFGQTFNATMLQMVAGFSSLINGGYYYQPTLVKSIVNENGQVVDSKEPVVVNETISAKTSEFIREAMYLTVTEGTAKPAKVEGYLVGGKTGTASKFPIGSGKYTVSFLGCVPANDPQVVIYTVLDEIEDETKKASSSEATKMSSKILKEVLPFLGLYPEGEIDYPVELPQAAEDENASQEIDESLDSPLVDENSEEDAAAAEAAEGN